MRGGKRDGSPNDQRKRSSASCAQRSNGSKPAKSKSASFVKSKSTIHRAKMKWRCDQCNREVFVWTEKCPFCTAEWSIVQHEDTVACAVEGIEVIGARDFSDRRITTGVPWFDEMTFGGIPPSYALLLGGEPGSGKSTFVTATSMLADVESVLYFHSEEPNQQVHNRAHELGLAAMNQSFNKAMLKHSSNPDELPRIVEKLQPQLIIVDSIHSMKSEKPTLRGRAGHHTQAKYVSELVVDLCKSTGAAAILISHISNGYFKGGPQVEHWVDAAMLMRAQRLKSEDEGEEQIRRVAKITKSRFCEVTGWRDVTVREWSQSYFHAKRKGMPVTREVDKALSDMLEQTTNIEAATADGETEAPDTIAVDPEFDLELS